MKKIFKILLIIILSHAAGVRAAENTNRGSTKVCTAIILATLFVANAYIYSNECYTGNNCSTASSLTKLFTTLFFLAMLAYGAKLEDERPPRSLLDEFESNI